MLVLNKNIERILILLMTLSVILEATIFNSSQILVEILLLTILFYLLIKVSISLFEIFMLIFMIFVSTYAFYSMSLIPAIILIKTMSLPLLAIIIFFKYELRSKLIHVIFFLCLSVVFLQIIIGYLPIPI